MYLLASAGITIGCSCPETFEYAADLENFRAWFPGVVNIVADDELPFATAGKHYCETVVVPLQGQRVVEIRVVDVRPPHRLVTEGDLPVLLPRMEIGFHEHGPNSCEVRWCMFSRNDNLLVRFAVLPFARSVMRTRATTGLRTLKRLLEASA
jgi:hypothetical protein